MTNYREKAREIKAAGEAERGNFEPHGAPLRLYNYWLNNSDSLNAGRIRSGRKKENFCHFWRVVAFWAPLMFLGNKLEPIVPFVGAVLVLAAIVSVGYIIFASEDTLEILAALVGIPVVAGVIVGAGYGYVWMVEKLWPDNSDEIINRSLVALVLGTAATFVGLMLTLLTLEFGVGILIAAAVVVSLPFVFYGLSRILGPRIEARRALAKKKAAENPAPVVDSEPREPGRMEKFFTSLGDFMVLVAQVVRVNKWKICPIVDVNANGKEVSHDNS